MKFSGKGINATINRQLTFGGDLDHCLDAGILKYIVSLHSEAIGEGICPFKEVCSLPALF